MKPKEWNEGLNNLDPDLVEEYVTQRDVYTQKKKPTRPYWIAAAAALLALVITLAAAFGGNPATPGTTGNPLLEHSQPSSSFFCTDPSSSIKPTTPPTIPSTTSPTTPTPSGIIPPDSPVFANLLAAPLYPEMVQYPNRKDFSSFQEYEEARAVYLANQQSQYNQPDGYADSLTNFFSASIAQFLQGEGNTAYSPLNVYMAMAMLAESTGGNSRQQILDLFGVNSIEELRTQAGHVWNAHYCDDGRDTILMANSLWLDHQFPYHQETADRLAQYYYASTFHGDLGTEALDLQLREWLNANTGGLLKEQANNVKLNPETVFALASTIYFTASWTDGFYKENTYDETFHAPIDDIQTPFMHQTRRDAYYRGSNFGAICLSLGDGNRMWLILPDEGFTTEDILKSDEYLQLTLNPRSQLYGIEHEIHLSLPKFDVVQQQDLIKGMKKLGITDVFNPSISDFSSISSMQNLFISQINHAARVTIDEKGCTAAAFTVIEAAADSAPPKVEELYFTLDRPFLFLVTSRDHLPLFAGVVNEP